MEGKAFVRRIKDIKAVVPLKHVNASSFPLVTPKAGGPDSVEFFVTETRAGGGADEDIHVDSDHVFFVISGHGIFTADGKSFEVGPGDAHFVPRNSKHAYKIVGDETLRMAVVFAPARK